MSERLKIAIAGAGDAGTATAIRLFYAGFDVFVIAENLPIDIYHARNFNQALFTGYKRVEGVVARTLPGAIEKGDVDPEISVKEFIRLQGTNREIPIVSVQDLPELKNEPVEYVFFAKPEFIAPVADVFSDSAVFIGLDSFSTKQAMQYRVAQHGDYAGRVLYPFVDLYQSAEKPAEKKFGLGVHQVKAPLEGIFTATKQPDEKVLEREEIGRINDIPILSPANGKISGILNSGIIVPAGTIFAEICSGRMAPSARIIPSENFNVAGAVLEAVLYNEKLSH